MQTRLHFSRFEFKYILPRDLRQRIEAELLYFIELDPYVASKPGTRYFVRSLYYDNQPMTCYYEKIDGMMSRAKFRLRTYTGDKDEPCAQFLEVKGRHNALVFKHRVQLSAAPEETAEEFSSLVRRHDVTLDILRRIENGEIKDRFLHDIHRKGYRPTVLIDYWRRPYFSKYDPEFRITFDDSLACYATPRLFPKAHENSRSVIPGHTILEVKFRYHVPKWFHRIIQAFELRRVSISKYCAGVDAFALAPKLE